MSDWNLPWNGACRCGQVRLRVSAPPMLTMACHCAGCQRMTSSAFSLSAAIPSQGFEVVAGEPVIGGLHGDLVHHYFCPHCMSWMFTKAEGMDWFVNVRTAMLETTADLAPFAETCTSEKLSWVTTPAKHSYGGIPAPEVFGELTKAFAKQHGGAT